MSLHFYAYARKGYEFIDEVAHELKTTDTDKAGRLTRCVVRALRKKLSIEDSFSLLAQLPMALKAVYVDGWKLLSLNEKPKISGFVSEVLNEDDNSAWRDFSNEEEVKLTIIAVFRVLSKHIIITEYEQLTQLLPPDLKSVLIQEIIKS
jgi:uncharacterized protein (DUF2267 family)